MCLRELQDFVALLFRDETECQFRHGLTSNDGLCPFPLITAADSIDLSRRPCPETLHRIVTCFAEKFGRACFLQDQFVAIDWKLPPSFTLPIFERLDPIVESRDSHTTFAVVKCSEQLRERSDRIRDGPAKDPGMQIHFWPGDLDFECRYSTEAIT